MARKSSRSAGSAAETVWVVRKMQRDWGSWCGAGSMSWHAPTLIKFEIDLEIDLTWSLPSAASVPISATTPGPAQIFPFHCSYPLAPPGTATHLHPSRSDLLSSHPRFLENSRFPHKSAVSSTQIHVVAILKESVPPNNRRLSRPNVRPLWLRCRCLSPLPPP